MDMGVDGQGWAICRERMAFHSDGRRCAHEQEEHRRVGRASFSLRAATVRPIAL